MEERFSKEFYKGKKVLITGHTGFKGSWMCKMLLTADAIVFGYSLDVPSNPSLYELCDFEKINSVKGDVRDLKHLIQIFSEFQPEIVIHMAAQPIVKESYVNPVYTYETNVLGTVNVLEAVRLCDSVKSVVIVTTDKVYKNNEWQWGYRENEELNGFDPYSNSKSCAELVTSCFKNSFFGGETGRMENGRIVAISTCRAGNVVGGGDFAKDRIIPDCVRALEKDNAIMIRNPYSIRPYQHVLEPVAAYLMIAKKQYEDVSYSGCYNVGPEETDCLTTGELVNLFCKLWNDNDRDGLNQARWDYKKTDGPHEAKILKLDCSKLKYTFGWKPRWSVETTVKMVVEWTKVYLSGGDIDECMERQINDYCKGNV